MKKYYFITYEVTNYQSTFKQNCVIDIHPEIFRYREQSKRDRIKEGKTVIISFYSEITKEEFEMLINYSE